MIRICSSRFWVLSKFLYCHAGSINCWNWNFFWRGITLWISETIPIGIRRTVLIRTGFCGITGSFLYLFLHSLGVKDYIIFFWLIPLSMLYLTNFLLLTSILKRENYFQPPIKEILIDKNNSPVSKFN